MHLASPGRDLRGHFLELRVDGLSMPLKERKGRLRDLLTGVKRIRYVDHVDDGATLFAVADKLELEGIVAKRGDAPYPRSGRSAAWVKIKTAHGRHVDEPRAKWNER